MPSYSKSEITEIMYIYQEILRSIYFPIFESHLNYATLIWTQNPNVIQRINILQKSHQNNITSASKFLFKSVFFFQKNNILKFSDKTMIHNILFISKTLNNIVSLRVKTPLYFSFTYFLSSPLFLNISNSLIKDQPPSSKNFLVTPSPKSNFFNSTFFFSFTLKMKEK